jgi:hypothetical protein
MARQCMCTAQLIPAWKNLFSYHAAKYFSYLVSPWEMFKQLNNSNNKDYLFCLSLASWRHIGRIEEVKHTHTHTHTHTHAHHSRPPWRGLSSSHSGCSIKSKKSTAAIFTNRRRHDDDLSGLVEVRRRFRGACCLQTSTTLHGANNPEHSHLHT